VTVLLVLVPLALLLGLAGLFAFLWSLRSDQYSDLDGAAVRMLADDDLPVGTAPTDRRTVPVRGRPAGGPSGEQQR
jgi:cbb3-type cytochrome oxidase maturation protein